MGNKTFINKLPFSREKEINTLVENKRTFSSDSMDLHVFETYQVSKFVPLRFDDLVLINMLEGKKIMHLSNVDAFQYEPGQMMLLPAYKEMLIDFPEATMANPTQCTALVISNDKIKQVMDYLNEIAPKHHLIDDWKFNPDFFHIYNTPELTELLNKLFKIMMSGNSLKNVFADLTFKELIIKLLQTQSLLALEIGKSSNAVLLHLKEFVRKHLTDKLTIDQLQKVANMSKSSLTRLFHNEIGVSPMEFVIRERMAKAKELLRSTNSVKEACFGSGFNDVNYFVRLFKKREGITPGGYILSK